MTMQTDLTQARVANGRIITPVRVQVGSATMGIPASLEARFAVRCDRRTERADGGFVSDAPSGSLCPFHPLRLGLIQGNTESPHTKKMLG